MTLKISPKWQFFAKSGHTESFRTKALIGRSGGRCKLKERLLILTLKKWLAHCCSNAYLKANTLKLFMRDDNQSIFLPSLVVFQLNLNAYN